MNGTLDELRRAARDRHDASLEMLGKAAGRPQLACYLMHVALECVLKCRILVMYNKTRIRDLQSIIKPNDFENLFFGKRGHHLGSLAASAALKRLRASEQSRLDLAGPVWERMCDHERPYSLRYGSEPVSREKARQEAQLGADIFKLIERGLP